MSSSPADSGHVTWLSVVGDREDVQQDTRQFTSAHTTGTNWDKLGQTGINWDKRGQTETNWAKLDMLADLQPKRFLKS